MDAPVGFEGMSSPPPSSGGLYPNINAGQRQSAPIGFEGPGQSSGELQPLPSYRAAMDSTESTSLVKNGKNKSGESVSDVSIEMKGSDGETPDENTQHLRDGVRRIDYILAYQDLADSEKTSKRESFHNALRDEGLDLEIEDKQYSQDMKTYFMKVHAPWRTCIRYAELLKMKMAIQTNDIDAPITNQCCSPCGPLKPEIEDEEDFFTAPFYRDGKFLGYKGPNHPSPDFFTHSQRSRIVHEILLRTRYGEEREQFGIRRLMRQSCYLAFFPLHDGAFKSETSGPQNVENKRQELYYHWARPKAFIKEQPYDAIRAYYGEKVGIYFSWLGFYTWMLVPASIVGIIVFIYGLATLGTDEASNEICNNGSDFIMCPLCDERCNYWRLNSSCLYSKVTYVVDNPATIFFTIFMALWATFFIEFWKRHQARIQYDWDVADYEEIEQNMRPEYEASVTSKKKNPITQDYEPHMEGCERCLRVCASLVFILFLICLVLAAILAIIIYRIFIVAIVYRERDLPLILRSNARLITTATAAILSLIVITLLNKVYEYIAIFLTNMETWKYQSEWEDAFTFKMYAFQFVNYYGTIVYIAFFKGKFIGSPTHYMELDGYRLDECDPAGCLIELAIQLAIVMVGKQALNNFKEVIVPMLVGCWKRRAGKKKLETEEDKYTSWERDYDLVDFPIFGLYEEYLEMVIQYGFVTLFVACFPLAPFFALLNNIVEVRLDAIKIVTTWKRPLAERAQDIGTWFTIIVIVSKLSVIVNACIIAFTSDFIPKSIYHYVYREDGNDTMSFMEWRLSTFRTADFEQKPDYEFENSTFGNNDTANHYCRYRDFRSGYNDGVNSYQLTKTYWHILTAQLAFVLVFEHVVLAVAGLINYLIPDTPVEIKDRTLREKHLAKVALLAKINVEADTGKRSSTPIEL